MPRRAIRRAGSGEGGSCRPEWRQPVPALSPEVYVRAFYEGLLGREPDPEGFQHWTSEIRSHGDPTRVLDAFLQSPEYQSRKRLDHKTLQETLATRACGLLGRSIRIVDIGAQLLGLGSEPYDPLRRFASLDVIGFDPLEEKIAERQAMEGPDGLTLLPYAIGDGGTHTLYINNDDATSSLFPLAEDSNSRFNHLSTLNTVRTMEVTTHTLDEVIPPQPIDFLKLDVQGSELMVLRSGVDCLSRTGVVHCEVEFTPIYEGQPLYPDIQQFLNAQGFELIDLVVPSRYHYVTQEECPSPDRLNWADAVFFKETGDPETLCAQAAIAAGVYHKPSLAMHLLERAARD